MRTQFALALRVLRQEKGLTQSELARRGGVARRTLTYWESGGSLPRTPELKAILGALTATPEESVQLIGLLNTPRGLRLAETERTTGGAKEFAGVGTGNLLRAMRMRHRLTQAELAARLRVSRQSVLRWEIGQNLIGAENLERLCGVLDAAPEEQLALRESRLTMPHWDEGDWRKVTAEETVHLWHEIRRAHDPWALYYRPQPPLFELQLLAMKQHLQLHVRPGPETCWLLANLETDYAMWLHFQDRVPEARAHVRQAVSLAREEASPQDFWGEMLNLAASNGYLKTSLWVPSDSIRAMEPWLARLPLGVVRTQQLCDMAFYMGTSGDRSQATALLEAAARSMDRAEEVATSETLYYDMTRERIALHLGRDLEISEGLLAQCPNDFQRIQVVLFWTPVLLRYGERRVASRYLAWVREMLTADTPARLRRLALSYSLQV